MRLSDNEGEEDGEEEEGEISTNLKSIVSVIYQRGVSSSLLGCKKSKEQNDCRPYKVEADALKLLNNDIDVDIPLPQGVEITGVAWVDLPAEDVGCALQFLEFCTAFKEDKQLKQKMLDKVAKAIIAKTGAPLSISVHEAVVLKIKTEVAQAHAEIMESQDMGPNGINGSAAVRTEPILLDIDGRWRSANYL